MRSGASSHRWPDVLPGGKAALFSVAVTGGGPDQWRIGLLHFDTRRWTTLVEGGSHPRYVPPGYIVYAQAGSLLAVPFDLEARGRRKIPPPCSKGS